MTKSIYEEEVISCTKMLDVFDIPSTIDLNGQQVIFTLTERVEFLCQLYADLAFDYVALARKHGAE